MIVKQQAHFVFDITLRIALIIALVMLVLGLVEGVDPLIAVFRSIVAFMAFAGLGWAASLIIGNPEAKEAIIEDLKALDDDDDESDEDTEEGEAAALVEV